LNPEARRAELLDAALRVLRERDAMHVRVEDVTQEAGTAKGTFYLYFASWNDLLVAVRDHLLSSYAAEVRTRIAAAAPSELWAALENECVLFVDYVIGLGGLHEAIFHGPTADQPIDATHSAQALISELLSAGIAAGACRSVDSDAASPLLLSLLHATADGIVRSGGRDRRLDAMLDMVRAWLRISGSALVTAPKDALP
jgi:AcrR family transcriptional regulator